MPSQPVALLAPGRACPLLVRVAALASPLRVGELAGFELDLLLQSGARPQAEHLCELTIHATADWVVAGTLCQRVCLRPRAQETGTVPQRVDWQLLPLHAGSVELPPLTLAELELAADGTVLQRLPLPPPALLGSRRVLVQPTCVGGGVDAHA